MAAWLGLVSLGVTPLIIQYPTLKQNRQTWRSSIDHTCELAQLDYLLISPDLRSQVERENYTFDLDALDEVTADKEFARRATSILQLSSGTTGHRKAIKFTFDQVDAHIAEYNRTMRLDTSKDRCVSWLPLYHDMGFIACFVMPLMLGVPITMMDPIDWIANPEMFLEAAETTKATYCHMPNFGFEVMTRVSSRPLPLMRQWISCSEPVYADTMRRFGEAHRVPSERLKACYAMAENVFAVSQSSGLDISVVDGTPLVSCGEPIEGVTIDIREGQIFVSSRTAVANYYNGAAMRDETGFYATGDLGFLREERLFVTGRVGDLLNIAGKKFMLNDLIPKAIGSDSRGFRCGV